MHTHVGGLPANTANLGICTPCTMSLDTPGKYMCNQMLYVIYCSALTKTGDGLNNKKS